MVTIKDVAKQAGVAPSTVSRVISDHEGISLETKQKVKEVMDKLGYVPNLSARKLVTKQSNTIGLVLKTASIEMRQNPFFTDVLISITDICKEKKYSTIMTTSMNDEDLLEEVKLLISSRTVDGLILLYSRENDGVMNYLKSINFPFVVIGRALNDGYNVMHVDNDNVLASAQLTEYMIGLGHTHLVFLKEQGSFAVSEDRMNGFKSICEKHNVKYDIYEMNTNRNDAIKIINQMVDLPTGIITSDSMMNLDILSALYERQIRIPEMVQTATFNDSYLNVSACPPQTVVNIYPDHLGRVAAKNLMELLNDKNMIQHNVVIPATIIERQSTKRIEA